MTPPKPIRVSRVALGLAVGLFGFVFVSIAINMRPHGWLSWFDLAIHGRNIQATVVSVQPEIHNTCRFRYVVNRQRYESADEGCRWYVGQLVTITYLPADPSFATSAPPSQVLEELTLFPFFAFFCGSVIGAMQARSLEKFLRGISSDGGTQSK